MLRNAEDCALVQRQLEWLAIFTGCRNYLSGQRGGALDTLDALIFVMLGSGTGLFEVSSGGSSVIQEVAQ